MSNLRTITDITNLNTSEVTNMSGMFYNCSNLTALDVSGFNTSKVTTMSYMFSGCSGLMSLDVSRFNTYKVTNMSYMFNNCSRLTALDVSGFYTLNVTDMSYMFSGCSRLTNLDLSRFWFSTNSVNMLRNCRGLKTLTISSSANNLNDNACSGIGSQSSPCSLIYPDEFNLNPSSTGTGWYQWKSGYFKDGPKAYAVLNGSTLTFYYNTNFDSNSSTMYLLNKGKNAPAWYTSRASVTRVVFHSTFAYAHPTSCYAWFSGMSNLTTVTGIENLKTDDVVYMTGMFDGCSGLLSLDLSSFNTAKVKQMNNMFRGCSQLTGLDVSNVTFNEEVQSNQFLNGCSNLQELTIPANANNLDATACSDVGSQVVPCTLIYPAGFTPEKTSTGDGWYQWKGGYFTDLLLGDANGDNTVTVADVMLTVNKVLGRELSTFNPKTADVNKDGVITVSDVMGIVKIVLSGGRASAPRNAYQTMSDAMGMTAKGNELTLHLKGTGSYTASQMIITLPEGCRLENAQMVSSRSNGHSVQTSDLGNGQYRVVVYGASGLPFGNSCSDLVRLNVKGNHNGDVAVSDIQVVDHLTNTFLLSDVSGIATDIDSIGSDASDDGDWYTTQGQKVATPTRGVYIRNGRKVVVR